MATRCPVAENKVAYCPAQRLISITVLSYAHLGAAAKLKVKLNCIGEPVRALTPEEIDIDALRYEIFSTASNR